MDNAIPTLVDNTERKRYEVQVEGQTAFVEYIKAKNAVYLTHTEVPPVLEGKGIGTALVGAVLQQLKDEQAKLAPLCPFVAAYLKRHPEWKTLLAPGYNV